MTPSKNRQQPRAALLDKAFKYTPACATDIRKTFKRVRAEMARDAQQELQLAEQPGDAVYPLFKAGSK